MAVVRNKTLPTCSAALMPNSRSHVPDGRALLLTAPRHNVRDTAGAEGRGWPLCSSSMVEGGRRSQGSVWSGSERDDDDGDVRRQQVNVRRQSCCAPRFALFAPRPLILA